MIIFDLSCRQDHRFEGWFRSADDFAAQQARGLIACPHCGSSEVRRLPSAVHLSTAASASAPLPQVPAPNPLAALKAAVVQIVASAENVGRDFPDEARRIHYHESPLRPIYGEASADECAALQEEGIDVVRLPAVKPENLN